MATSRTASNAYFELLKELERDLFPVVAAATQTRRATHPSGTFFPLGTPPPSIFHGIKAARGLSGLTIIFVAGVSALCFVRRRSVRLTTEARICSTRNVFLFFTFLNSAVQLLYLSRLPDPHDTINLVAHAFRNFCLLAQGFSLAYTSVMHLVGYRRAAVAVEGRDGHGRGSPMRRCEGFALVGIVVLLLADLATSINSFVTARALRASFGNARVNLLLLANSPTAIDSDVSTASIVRVLAAPIDAIQSDLQRLRTSEIAKDATLLAGQVAIVVVSVLSLSTVSRHVLLPRCFRSTRLRTSLPVMMTRFKRASSISKLPVVPVEAVEEEEGEEEAASSRTETLQSVSAVASLAAVTFLFAVLTNYVLALDVLGRRWTEPITSFGPTELWSCFWFSSVSIAALIAVTYVELSPSSRFDPTTTTVVAGLFQLSSSSSSSSVARPRDQGYVVPPVSTTPRLALASPLASSLVFDDDDDADGKKRGSSGVEEDVSSPTRAIEAVPVLESYPFPAVLTAHADSSTESVGSDVTTCSSGSSSSSSSSVGYVRR
ncbi:hypothetical protein JCM3766R1_004578 [Sporobolomyces carnicolor]